MNAPTFSPTVLVHEAFLKLNDGQFEFENRAHLMAMVSRAMRFILLDRLKEKQSHKREGFHVSLTAADLFSENNSFSMIQFAESLAKLETLDPRLVQVAECRLFGELTNLETAQALALSLRTVERLWRKAKLYMSEWLDPK